MAPTTAPPHRNECVSVNSHHPFGLCRASSFENPEISNSQDSFGRTGHIRTVSVAVAPRRQVANDKGSDEENV